MGFLQNKKALIVGLASNRSIAYGIAEALHREGAQLAFTYQNERLQSRVEKMAAQMGSHITMPCDVASDDEIRDVFTKLREHWDGLDILIHSVAYAPGELLEGDYVANIHRQGFNMAHEISSYSLVALAQALLPMMEGRHSSILTLTYIGSERAMNNYNVMGVAKASLEANVRYMAFDLGKRGIRVNAISAGPIRTLAASGIKNFRAMLQFNESITPLRSNVSIEQVGNAAAFMCSDLASGITGEVLHVDAGYHITGMSMPASNAPSEESAEERRMV